MCGKLGVVEAGHGGQYQPEGQADEPEEGPEDAQYAAKDIAKRPADKAGFLSLVLAAPGFTGCGFTGPGCRARLLRGLGFLVARQFGTPARGPHFWAATSGP